MPDCEAVIVETPAARMVTVEPEIVATPGLELENETSSPEEAMALIEHGAAPSATGDNAPKRMD